MEHNDPGREPDPTDAGLLKRLAAEIRASEIGVGSMESGNLAIDAVIIRGHEYLSGARPMPDTPAPDEVAQLRTEVERLTKGVRSIATMCEQCNGMDEAVTRAWKILHGEQPLGPCSPCGRDLEKARIADLETEVARLKDGLRDSRAETAAFSRQITRDKDEITTLTASIAELERELADLVRALAELQKDRDRLWHDRYALLGAKLTDGLSSSEWVMRTATAERKVKDLERENAALREERDRLKESCRIVLGFGKAIISDASINGILDGAPTTLLFQTVDEEHTIGIDATGYGRDNLEPGDGNVQIVFTKAESVDVVIDTLVKIKGAIESAVSAGKEAPDAE